MRLTVDPLRKAYLEHASMLADPPELTGMHVRFLVAVMTSDGRSNEPERMCGQMAMSKCSAT